MITVTVEAVKAACCVQCSGVIDGRFKAEIVLNHVNTGLTADFLS